MYDVMGMYDIGDDDFEGDAILGDSILGRHRMHGESVPASVVEQAAIQRRMQQGTVLRQYQPQKGRQLILGFSSTGTVAAGATVDIIQRPQLTFRPERVIIPAAIGANFNVADIRIGKDSQFLSAGVIPAAVFAEGAFGVRLKMDTAQIAMDIDLRVTNISAGALNFFAAMIGDSVQ